MSGYTVGPSRRLHKARKNLVNRLLFPTVVLLLVACTASRATSESTTTLAPSPLPEVAHRPAACPSEPHIHQLRRRNNVPGTDRRRNNVPGTDKRLVPRTPSSIVFCGPAERTVIDDKRLVGRIANELNGLKLIPRGEFFWGCPVERHASPTHGLFFNYPNGDVLLVTIATGGCLFAGNGQRMAFTDATVRRVVLDAFAAT